MTLLHQVSGSGVTRKLMLKSLVWLDQGLMPWSTAFKMDRWPLATDCLAGLVVKASALRAEDPGFESRLRRDFFGVESYQWLKNWHSSGYPARRLALEGQCWDWSARCQYAVTGCDGKFGLQLLSQCGGTQNCADPSLRYTCMLLGR